MILLKLSRVTLVESYRGFPCQKAQFFFTPLLETLTFLSFELIQNRINGGDYPVFPGDPGGWPGKYFESLYL